MTIIPKKNKLSPLLKYPGGKEKELSYILPNLPINAKNYYKYPIYLTKHHKQFFNYSNQNYTETPKTWIKFGL